MGNLYTMRPQQQVMPSYIPEDVPVYRVNDQRFYADDEMFNEGDMVVWPDEPNFSLEPMNELAKKNMIAWLTKVDEGGRAKSKKDGKAFVSYLAEFMSKYEPDEEDPSGHQNIRLDKFRKPSILGKQRVKRRSTRFTMPEVKDMDIHMPRPADKEAS